MIMFMALIVYNLETINSVASLTWHSFSTQNYFDQRGVFLSVIVGLPLLIIISTQVLLALYSSAFLLIKVKRKQLLIDKKKK